MHFLDIICADIGFKFCIRDVTSKVQWVPMYLRGPAGPRGPFIRLGWVAVTNFPGMHIRSPAAN